MRQKMRASTLFMVFHSRESALKRAKARVFYTIASLSYSH